LLYYLALAVAFQLSILWLLEELLAAVLWVVEEGLAA
jgi:hypothetical protein